MTNTNNIINSLFGFSLFGFENNTNTALRGKKSSLMGDSFGPMAEAMLKMLDPEHLAVGKNEIFSIVEALIGVTDHHEPIMAFVVYEPETGNIQAMRHNSRSCLRNAYDLEDPGSCPAWPIHLALWPSYMEDPEFAKAWEIIKKEYARDSFKSNPSIVHEAFFVACTSAWQRVQRGEVKLVCGLIPDQLDLIEWIDGKYDPEECLLGKFELLKESEPCSPHDSLLASPFPSFFVSFF